MWSRTEQLVVLCLRTGPGKLCRQPFLLDIASWLAVMSEAPSQRKAGWLDSDQDTQTKANYILDPEQEVFNPTIAILGLRRQLRGLLVWTS